MGYKPLRNEDSLSELVSTINDFNIVAKRLMANLENTSSFMLWLHKCVEVDWRSAWIYLNNNKKKFSDAQWKLCLNALPSLDKRRSNINEYLG